jgi:RNA polymerase sigma-70 factor (ECF subfamily)
MNALMTAEIKQQEKDETELVRHAITDVEAFAELYRRHLTRVYRYHMAHIGNVKDAEDLTSQTFMAVLEGVRSFRGSGSFAAWVMGIASKKRLMFFRKNGNRSEIPLEAALQYPSPDLPTDKAAHQRLQLASVSRALRQISPDRAEAIVLTFFGGLSNAEAAHVLNKSEAAVKMLVSRGLQDLRERTSLALEVEQ